jgi:putative iron-dependent peroxidase
MRTPQAGIFALGTASHAYLEFDGVPGRAAADVVAGIAALREPRTTMGGVNLVAGFRPLLWAEVVPHDAPAGVDDFDGDLVGADGFVMPATQHDAVLWLSGSAYDVIFEVARKAIAELGDVATVAEETSSWPYMHDRDLTGFIDGTRYLGASHCKRFAAERRSKPGALLRLAASQPRVWDLAKILPL